MAEATRTQTESQATLPAVGGDSVTEQVSALRERAHSDPELACEQAWTWISTLGERARRDRAGALGELQELFLCGRPAEGIDGQTEGLLVAWTISPVTDRLLGSITNAWMPWLGKKFGPNQSRGVNTLTRSARLPAKIPWPLYSTSPSPLGRSAFEFTTYREAGKLDPAVDVLVIDYGSVESNPRLLIRQVRDELVQIVPGANLGKMLVRLPRRKQLFPALYFALKSEL